MSMKRTQAYILVHNIKIEFDFFSIPLLLLNFLLLLLLLSSLLYYYCYYSLRIIYNILYVCASCEYVHKRLVVASQWTCCYADVLLFRVG